MVWILVESDWICLQHSILVLTIFSYLIAMMGLCMAWFRWTYMTSVLTGLGLSILGFPAATTLQPRLLLAYIVLDSFDVLAKIVTILDLVFIRRTIRDNCVNNRTETCTYTFDKSRVILLNYINGIIFLAVSTAINLILLISAIHLYNFIRKCLQSLLKRDPITGQQSRDQIYGTFGNSSSFEQSFENLKRRIFNKSFKPWKGSTISTLPWLPENILLEQASSFQLGNKSSELQDNPVILNESLEDCFTQIKPKTVTKQEQLHLEI